MMTTVLKCMPLKTFSWPSNVKPRLNLLSIGFVFVSSLFTDETFVVCSGNQGRVVPKARLSKSRTSKNFDISFVTFRWVFFVYIVCPSVLRLSRLILKYSKHKKLKYFYTRIINTLVNFSSWVSVNRPSNNPAQNKVLHLSASEM